MTSSNPNDLSKSPPTNSNTLEVRAPAYEFEMGLGTSVLNTHCEPTAVLKGKKLCCEQSYGTDIPSQQPERP